MHNKLLVVLIILMVILITVISLGGFYLYSEVYNNHKEDKQTEIKIEEGEVLSYDYKDSVFNITNSKGKEKILKLSFTLKVSGDKELLTKLDEYKADMDDAIIGIISGTDSDILMKPEGKNLLKDEITTQLNQIFIKEEIPFKINKVLITGIILK